MGKENNLYLIKDLIKLSIPGEEYKQGIKIQLLKNNWANIVGDKLCLHTEPEKIYGKKLYIKCSHQGWINTLQFYKKDILKNIKKIFESDFNVEEVVFSLGKIKNKLKSKKIENNEEILDKTNIRNTSEENFKKLLKEFLEK